MSRKQIIIILLVTLLVILALHSILVEFFSLNSLQKHAHAIKSIVNSNYLIAFFSFTLLYGILIALSFPGAAALTLLAGFLFGTTIGTISVNIGATAGATAAFLLTRMVAGSALQNRYADKLTLFNRHIEKNGAWYLLSIRLIPIFPFFLINVLAGLTRIPTLIFIWTTSLGIIPGSIVYTFAGKQLATIRTMNDIVSIKMLLAFSGLSFLSLLPLLLKTIGILPTKK